VPNQSQQVPQEVLRGLACAALSPGLRSVLVFDAEPQTIKALGAVLAELLHAALSREVRLVHLRGVETDDDLWSSLRVRRDAGSLRFQHVPGPLAQTSGTEPISLVLVPDLTRLSVAAARAGVMLIGADVANLERYGQRARWSPRTCWLAGCSTGQVGRVSPHLLDRFMLRLPWPTPTAPDVSPEAIVEWASKTAKPNSEPVVGPTLLRQLNEAAPIQPEMPIETIEHVLRFFPPTGAHSPRRELALARLAAAQARLAGHTRVTSAHVDSASKLIGLQPPAGDDRPSGQRAGRNHTVSGDHPARTSTPDASTANSLHLLRQGDTPSAGAEPVMEPGAPEALPAAALPLGGSALHPYPEDEAPVEREAQSLQLPTLRHRPTTADRGPIVGVRRATSLQDLALISTLLTAAKFQPVRRRSHRVPPEDRRLLLSATDLRTYLRAPIPESMLALVLDHTCTRDWDWSAEVAPYLRWAYAERAAICLVQVGAKDAPNELQASRIVARSLLDPRVGAALDAQPGDATPLAHGLDLTFQALRHATQHGDGGVRRAWIVVLTDARGNVPLNVSHHGTLPHASVGREGILDALQAGRRLRTLDRAAAVLLNPEPRFCADLPAALGEALGATVVAAKKAVPEELAD
jgi:magnesium chelatase subunit D